MAKSTKTVKKATKKATKKPVSKVAKKVAKKATKKVVKKATKKPSKKPVSKVAKKVVKKATKSPKKVVSKKSSSKSSSKVVKLDSVQSDVKRPVQRQGFKTGENIVYPAHGVGKIVDYDQTKISGYDLTFFTIFFSKDKMTVKVPIEKIKSVGMRKLADQATVRKALKTVQGKAKIKRVMWSRRAQEYEAKINSGDLLQISEVVRDLFRSESETEQSYSERQLYEAALDKMVGELAAIRKITITEATHLVEANLSKRPARTSRLATPPAATTATTAATTKPEISKRSAAS